MKRRTLEKHVTLCLYVAQRRAIHFHGGESLAPGGLGMALRARFQGYGSCCQSPGVIERPAGPQATPYTMSQHPDWLYLDLVPDGVATVRWTFPRSIANQLHLTRHGRTVTVRVHDNVAAIALPHPGVNGSGGTRSDTWYSPTGRRIASHTS